MSRPDWQRVEELFHRVVDLPTAERRKVFDRLDDSELEAEVESLLAADEVAEDMVDGAVAESVEWLAEPKTGALPDLGPYRPLRELGRGGFGTVYLAERTDQEFRFEVAVKRLRGDFGATDLAQRFLLERQILARLDHPNIGKLFDAGTSDGGDPYFVMEYIDGVPIDRHCQQLSLDLRQRLQLMLEVCAAVSYAHRNLVVHRDLKPSNILVTAEGVPKLLDFGIAKLLDDGASSAPEMTRTGFLPLTPEFASPEQVRGEPLTTASDVYSLGMLLYRLLSGTAPYVLPTPRRASVIERIICEEMVPSMSHRLGEVDLDEGEILAAQRGGSRESLRRELRGDLDNIVAKALRKEPERRYDSVQQLADDLDRHLQRRPVSATGDSLAYVAGRFLRRHWLSVGTVALLLLSLLGGIVTTTYQMRQAKRHQARAERVIDLLVDDVFGSATKDRPADELPDAREILDHSALALDRQLVEAPFVHGTVLAVVGGLYQRLGTYDRAQVFLQRGAQRLRSLLGDDHPEVLKMDSDLGDVLLDQKHFAAADLLLGDAVAEQRKYPKRAADLAASLRRQAQAAHGLGDIERAQHLIAEALQLHLDIWGEQSLQLAEARALRAQFARQARDLETAERLFQQVLEVQTRWLGDDHRDVLRTLSDLAVCAYDRQDYARAEDILLRVVALNEKIHGPVHRDVADPLINLGAVQRKLGHYDDAVPVLERALDIQRRVFGPEGGRTLIAARNLARLHLDRGALEEARLLVEENLHILERQQADALEIAKYQLDLADLESEGGNYAQAEDLYWRIVQVLDERLPDGHPYRALGRYQLGRIQCHEGRWTSGEDLLQQALGIQRQALGDDHYRTHRTQAELGLCWLAQGRREGRRLLDVSLPRLEAELASNDPILRWIRQRQATVQ